MGRKTIFVYNMAGGALAGMGVGYGIDPRSATIQILLAAVFGLGLAIINQRMDDDQTFPSSDHVKVGMSKLADRFNYLAGGGLGKRGALKMIFISLAFISVFWFARDATEQYAYEWFGYDTQEFVEERWPIVIGIFFALLGGYRYMTNGIAKGES